MNGVENLRQRFNGQRQAKNNQRLVTCFTLKEQWRLSINSLLLFGFDAHEMINLIENVAPETKLTDLTLGRKLVMLSITGESNAPPAAHEA